MEKRLNDGSGCELAARCRDFDRNYALVLERLERAAEKAGRPVSQITLLAATKTVPAPVINHALAAGVAHIGENRVQEYLSKYEALRLDGVGRHFIGHLQTNKVKQIVDKVDMIESVDSVRLAAAIGEECKKLDKTMDILIEVNIGDEENKSGVNPAVLEETVRQIAQIKGVSVQGLMAIPPICDASNQIRHYFKQMRELFIDIGAKKIDNSHMVYLSMGMSGDFDTAVEEGANLVRVGAALFGKRL